MSEKIQDDDIDSDNEFQYADILAREPTSLVHVDKSNNNNNDNYYNDNEEEEEGGGGEDDDQPLLEGEYGSERSLNNDNSSKDIELRIPVRLQRMKASAKKKQVIHKPYFTIFISVVDVLMMIIEIIINKGFVSFKKNPWIGVSLDTLIMMGGKDTGLITATTPQLWRLLTPVFLHVGLGHLALNLLAQLLLGFQLEKTLGSVRVIIIYFVSAIAGNLMSAVFLPYQLEVGASTAIYGLGSYYLVDLMVHWSLIIAPMRYFVGLMIGSVVGLLFGLLPGIDNFAHIGGSAGGFLISLLLVPRTKEGKSLKYAKIAFYLGPPLLLSYFALGFVILFTPLRWAVWNCHWCEYMNCLPVFHWCSS